MASLKRVLLPSFLLLCAAHIFSFGLFTFHLGFYHDDWSILEMLSRGGSFWGAVEKMPYWSRPVENLQYPIFYALGGFHPWVYHLLLAALQCLEGLLLFLFLDDLLEWPELSLGAAVLAVMSPNRDVVHFWFANSPQTVTQVLTLASLVAHQRWLKTRNISLLIGAQLCYLLGVLSYESCSFMPLFLGGGLFARRVLGGSKSARAAAETTADLWPYAATLGLALFWQWIGLRWLLHASNPKSDSLGFSLAHFLKAYGAGFECITNRVLHLCALTAAEAFREFWSVHWGPIRLGYLWLSGTLLLAVAMVRWKPGDPSSRCPFVAIMAILGGFIGAYAPYALSGSYMPQIYGIMSRTNGAGAWVGGLLWAYALDVLGRSMPRAKFPTTLLILGAFTWGNWANAAQWVRSWSLQKEILNKAGARAASLPRNSVVILAGAPSYVGWAVVFDAPYDFDSALRLTTRRPDLQGNVWSPQFRFAADRLVECYNGKPLKRYSYDNLYEYYYDKDLLEPISKPKTSAILLQFPVMEAATICEKP